MKRIDNLTAAATQQTKVILDDGTILIITLTYLPASQRWMVSLTRGDFVLNGRILCVLPNILRQWQNVINFGMACISTDGVDPVDIGDFVGGDAARVKLYVLSADEVAHFEALAAT